MWNKIAVDAGHGYTKALSSTGERVLFPSLIAPAPATVDLGSLAGAAEPTRVQWAGLPPRHYLAGEDAQLLAQSLFSGEKAGDMLTRDITVIATSRLVPPGTHMIALAVGVPLTWYAREKEPLGRALTGQVVVDDRHLVIQSVTVLPQGAAAVFAALAPDAKPGLYGVVDVGYRTTDYLVVQIDPRHPGRLSIVPGLAGTTEIGVYNALQAAAAHIERQYRVTYAPHELARTQTITVRGDEVSIAGELGETYQRVAQTIGAKMQTVWSTVSDRLAGLYLVGGGADALTGLRVGDMPGQPIPDPQWANARGYLAAMGPR